MKINASKGLWVAALCLMGALMLLMNLLTPMICDDYRYAFSFATGERITKVGEIFPSLAAHGHVLNGRYAPHFFVQLFALLPGICFDAANTAVFLLLVIGVYRLALGDGEKWDALLLCGVFGGLFLLPPVFGQNMLWMAGSCNYLWPAAALVWLMKPFVDAVSGKEVRLSWPLVAGMAALALLFGNCSENLSAAGLMLMGLCILAQLFRCKGAPLWMWITAAATLAGWLLLMLAPVDKPVGMVEAGFLGMMMDRFTQVMQLWLKHLGVLTAVWAFLLCMALDGEGRERVLASVLLALCALCCHLAMIISEYVPERALLGPILLMVCACCVLLPGLGGRWMAIRNGLCLCLCLLAALNALMALPQVYNRHQQAVARDAAMVEAAAAGQADVVTFGVLGRTKYDAYTGLIELSSAPEHFANVAYAEYYGVESVTVGELVE